MLTCLLLVLSFTASSFLSPRLSFLTLILLPLCISCLFLFFFIHYLSFLHCPPLFPILSRLPFILSISSSLIFLPVLIYVPGFVALRRDVVGGLMSFVLTLCVCVCLHMFAYTQLCVVMCEFVRMHLYVINVMDLSCWLSYNPLSYLFQLLLVSFLSDAVSYILNQFN